MPPTLLAARISERDRTTLANDQLRVRNALGKLGVDDNDIQLLGSYGGPNMDLSIVVRGELKLTFRITFNFYRVSAARGFFMFYANIVRCYPS